jgi:ABC-type Mn2+/Zn2+ transport system permease subunit
LRKYLGALLAVSVLAAPSALASIIFDRPEDVLTRSVVTFDPTPERGPKFHLIEGPEVIVYSRPPRDESAAGLFSVFTVSFGFGIALLSLVPKCQRVMILLKLLDSR